MKIKDLPVGTKYKQAQGPRVDTSSTFIIVDIKYMQDTFGTLEDEVGMSYCIDNNEIVPWRGHELCECIIVE